MEYTTNYQLNQWDAQDAIKRTDFNADNAKIDAALGELKGAVPRVITGTYVGTGTTEVTHYSVGARPKLLILWTNNYFSGNTFSVFLIATENTCLNFTSAGGQGNSNSLVTFDDDGFTIDHSKSSYAALGYNAEGKTQTYWALC